MSTASSIYSALSAEREPYISRAEECSQLTIPSVFVKRTSDTTEIGEQVDPYNSIGARGLRNLSSKFMMSLFPANQSFFKYDIPDDILGGLPEGTSRGDIEEVLSQASRVVNQHLARSNLRREASEFMPNLLVTGNPLIFVREDLNFEFFSLNNFVIERDRMGRILKIVIKETFKYETLPQNLKDMCDDASHKEMKNIDVYTLVRLNDEDRYESHQEIFDKVIESTKSVYPKGINPYIAPRIFKIAGEHYGRSYIEEFIGDLRDIEVLSKSISDMALASSRSVILVSPTSVTDINELNSAENGDFVPGNPNDFNPLTINLSGEYAVVKNQHDSIENRLGQAMLLFSAVQRNAERVTAEEVRTVSNELDSALSGAFSLLADEFQKPLVNVFQWRLRKAGVIKIPKDLEVSVLTGVEAIAQGQNLGRLNSFINSVLSLSQAGINLTDRLNASEILTRIAAGSGIDSKGLVKTDEQISAEQQQAMAMQALNSGELGKAMGKIAVNNNDPAKIAQQESVEQQQ